MHIELPHSFKKLAKNSTCWSAILRLFNHLPDRYLDISVLLVHKTLQLIFKNCTNRKYCLHTCTCMYVHTCTRACVHTHTHTAQ